MSEFLQANIVTLICFDEERAPIIRGAAETELFEGPYRRIATAAYSYIDKYKKAPKEHIADLMEKELSKKDRKSKHLGDLLKHLHRNAQKVNPEYVMHQLEVWIRHQEYFKATQDAGDILVQRGETEEAVEQIESIFTKAVQRRMKIFDPGTMFGSVSGVMRFLDRAEEDVIITGIPELDRHKLGPVKKALHLFIGLPKRGKSWWLVNLGKNALKTGRRVCHITLENSEELTLERYCQAFFAVAKRKPTEDEAGYFKTRFVLDEDKWLSKIAQRKFKPKRLMSNSDISAYLESRLKRRTHRWNRLIVKEFPTGSLSLRNLETYLDSLRLQFAFEPDLLIIDYPQLMRFDPKNYRLELGKLIQGLRGIAVERNLAVAVVGQSNRGGFKKSETKVMYVDLDDIGEDFSQAATADTVITYNQTDIEKDLGLARLWVAAARSEEDRFGILITQHYATGQFCRSSIRAPKLKRYSQMIAKHAGDSDDEEDEEDDE